MALLSNRTAQIIPSSDSGCLRLWEGEEHWPEMSITYLPILTGFSCFALGSSHFKPPHSSAPVIFCFCSEKVPWLVSSGSFLLLHWFLHAEDGHQRPSAHLWRFANWLCPPWNYLSCPPTCLQPLSPLEWQQREGRLNQDYGKRGIALQHTVYQKHAWLY